MSTVPGARQRFLFAVAAFVLVLVVGYGSDLIVPQKPEWMIADDLVLAVIAAIVVFRYERERSRFLTEKLHVIRDMNAFVRNELQILYASMDRPEETRVPTIERSVARIDWALRELLPGGHATEVDSEPAKVLTISKK